MTRLKNIATVVALLLFFGGCSSMSGKHLLGNAVGSATDTEVAYNRQCVALQNRCGQGVFKQWQTSDGVPGCSCKKL